MNFAHGYYCEGVMNYGRVELGWKACLPVAGYGVEGTSGVTA